MALFKQHSEVNKEVEIQFAYMRIAHDGHHINALIKL